jgi:pimeloyl-ACP methyl ester carboxylesterase
MKTKLFFCGMLGIILALGLVVVGCSKEGIASASNVVTSHELVTTEVERQIEEQLPMEKSASFEQEASSVAMEVPIAPASGAGFDSYSLKSLQNYPYQASPLLVNRFVSETDDYRAYDFSYTTMGLTVSGRFRLPKISSQNIKGIVILLRGFQNASNYSTGKGSEYMGRFYLRNGYAVIAPDFLGYGASSATPSPAEAHQFYSTVNAVELYMSLLSPHISYTAGVPQNARPELPTSFKKIYLWGHSNGGQVAIQTLEVLKAPIPTVLWAPVSLAFPDSAAYYREGRTGRRSEWAEQFKKEYTAADFSLYTYLPQIAPGTPILLEQGTLDTDVPKSWSDAFVKAIADENANRTEANKIKLTYQIYPDANHNLEPYSSTVYARDVAFWDAH